MTNSGTCWFLGIAVGGVMVMTANCVLAQNITLDGTLGPSGILSGPNYIIPQAVGQTVDNNLFHSFGRFGLDAGEIANFQSGSNIRNILSRVTGGFPSSIDGLIFTSSPNVNLFLINPSGILFGPNARLDVGGINRGSFVATTADALVWSNGGQFSAVNPGGASSLLTLVGDPSGFLASLRPPQPITISGSNLSVPNGQSLLFLGGNLSLDGASLQAPGGQLALAGVAGIGSVGLDVNGNNLSLNLPENVVRADVLMTNSFLDVVASGGGDIAIHARNLDIFDSILRAGITSSFTDSAPRSGDITLDSTETTRIGQNSIVANAIFRGSTGNSGNINIKAKSLLLSGGSGIGSFIFGSGNAGNVVIQASDSVTLTGRNTILDSTIAERAEGQGGEIDIQTGVLSLTDDAQIGAVTFGRGNAGSINIQADSVSLSGELTGILSNVGGLNAEGQGGAIRIQTRTLSLSEGAGISSSTIDGQGDAGNINITARDSVSLSDSLITSRIDLGIGNGGDINITTGSLSLTKGAAIANDSDGVGDAGNITIKADSVSLAEGSALSATTFEQGNAGNISVQANNTLFLRDSNILTSVGEGAIGQGGDITIQAGSISLMETTNQVSESTTITSSTFGQGDSGNIQVRATGDISLVGTGGFVTGVDAVAVGNGGDINVEARSLSLADGAQLFANTFGEGNAGNIQVTVTDFVNLSGVNTNGFSSGLLTNTESEAIGQGGNIQVTAPTLQVSDGAVLSAITRSAFRGGNITVDTNTLEATGGGQILTSAFSSGDAGNISINANNRITLSGSDPSFFSRLSQLGQADPVSPISGLFANTEDNSTGRGGSIALNTGNLVISDGAGIGINSSGAGSAGEFLTINARDAISIDNGIISSQLGTEAVGRGGTINLQTRSLQLRNNAQVTASTLGQGDAGTINIDAPDSVSISGVGSGLFTSTASGANGEGGAIQVKTADFQLTDGAVVNAQTSNSRRGGNVTIEANTFEANNGGQVITTTNSSGRAGDIALSADRILLEGASSGLFANTASNSTGQGGNLTITTEQLQVQDGASVTVSSPQAQAGNLTVTAKTIFLNRGRLSAETALTRAESGANITLQGLDFLLLQNGSRISAQANGDAQGGNITIDATRGFIAAPPGQDSDIIASASFGQGGNITINTQQIFGIAEGRAIPGNRTNDIDASSEFNRPGTVTINTTDLEPTRGLVELPTSVVDTSGLVASSCTAFANGQGSEFIVTGRGGLPPSPDEPLTNDIIWTDTRIPTITAPQPETAVKPSPKKNAVEVIPATGWVFNGKGEVTLISASNTATLGNTNTACAKR